MKQYRVEAAVCADFIWVGKTFRSAKYAIEHCEFIRKIGEHRNVRYRVRDCGGRIVKAWPKFNG